jgi:hypothetical protein
MTKDQAKAELARLQAIWQKNASPKMVTSYSFSNRQMVLRIMDLQRFIANAKDEQRT